MEKRELAQRISQGILERYGENLNADLIYSQLAHETGNFTSKLSTDYHNYGGLTQTTPNDLKQPDGENYYMSFDSDESFADYMIDYLYKYKEDGLFNAIDAKSYATALKNGGYFGDSVDNYVAGMQSYLGQEGFSDFAMIAKNAINPLQPVVKQGEDIEEASFEDKLNDSLYDSAIWGWYRTAAATRDLPDEGGFKLTQKDIDTVQKELGGDYTATLWVCQNAHSNAQLQKLLNMKKEDLERRKRVDASDIGLNTFGTVLGTMLDPINYIPVLGATGKVGSMARYAKMAAGAAGGNVVERGFAQHMSGYEQNYAMAALMGAGAGGLLPLSMDLMGKGFNKLGQKLYTDAVETMENAERLAEGKRGSNTIFNDDDFVDSLRKAHDTSYVDNMLDKDIARHIDPEKGVYVVSKADAVRIAHQRGIELPENAKGVFDDESGIAFLIKDNLADEDDLRKTLLHEKGAHGLKYVLSENEYNKIMAEIRFRALNNPSPAFQRALKRAIDKGDPEEVLGYLAEEMKPSNPLLRNIKKKLDKALEGMGVKEHMSDEDFLDLLRRSAEINLEGKKGYRVVDDGDCIFKGFRYSEKSILNPSKLDEAAEANGWGKRVKTFLKRAAMFATPYTVCSASTSSTMRRLGERLLMNPYMDKALNFIPIEAKKSYVLNQANRYINSYHKIRDKAVLAKAPIRGRFSATMKEDFDRKVWEAYNVIHGKNIANHIGEQFDPDVLEAVQCIKELRDFIIDTMKNSNKIFGEGMPYLPADWENIDDELWRFLDNSKRASFITAMGGKENAIKALTEYGIKAAKRAVFRKRLEKKLIKEISEMSEKPAVPLVVTDEMVEETIAKEAKEWATGIIDQNASNRYLVAGNVNAADVGNLEFMRHRFAMDTSTRMSVGIFNDFSFDDYLRSFDFDNTVPFLLNRFAGDLALSTLFSRQRVSTIDTIGDLDSFRDDINNLRFTIEEELKSQEAVGRITKSQIKDELDTFDYMFDKLLGVSTNEEPKTRWDAFAKSLKDYSYARNAIYMGLNQLSEIGGTLAYQGFPALFDLIPSVGKMVDEARLGKMAPELLEDAVLDTFGETTTRYIFHNTNSTKSTIWKNVGTNNAFDKTMDAVGGVVRTSASFVTAINGLSKLTDNMVFSARKQMLIDTVKWVNGKGDIPWYRNPFSTRKLEAAGIKNADDFRQLLKPYMQMDAKGNLKGLDIKRLQKDDPDTFMRLYTLLDNQARRCITQESIGNSNMLKESNVFWKIFFQFKDFTMRATHSQSLRVINNHEIDDVMATAFSVVTTIPVTLAVAYSKAHSMYHNDKQKRDRYLENYLEPRKLAVNAFLRSSVIGSPLSTLNDISEITGYSLAPTIRTTVNRDKSSNIFNNPEETLGSVITQLPAVDTALDIGTTGYNVGRAILGDYALSDKDFRRALSLMPAQNSYVLLALREELSTELHLPKKNK